MIGNTGWNSDRKAVNLMREEIRLIVDVGKIKQTKCISRSVPTDVLTFFKYLVKPLKTRRCARANCTEGK